MKNNAIDGRGCGRRRWRWPLAACGGGSARRRAASGGGGSAAPFNAGDRRGLQPVRPEGRHAPDAPTPATGTRSTRATPTTGYSWNFARLYGRVAGDVQGGAGQGRRRARARTSPSRLGKPSDDGKTWTYTLRKGVKFEDGTPVTSKDVKYAVERSLDKDDVPATARRTSTTSSTCRATRALQGHEPGQAGPQGDRDAGRPDDRLPPQAAVLRFDYFAQLPSTSRCRRPRTPAAKYKEHVVSTGPYMFETYDLGKCFALVRNPNWDPATDPNRKALPDQIEVAAQRQRRRHRQPAAWPATSTSTSTAPACRPAAQGRILADPTLKANTDNP